MTIRAHRISREWVVYVAESGLVGFGNGTSYDSALARAIEDREWHAGRARLQTAIESREGRA